MDNIIKLPAPGLALAHERELDPDPRNVLADLFEEELLPDPAATADAAIRRLADAGFVIKPAEN